MSPRALASLGVCLAIMLAIDGAVLVLFGWRWIIAAYVVCLVALVVILIQDHFTY